jgi:hypothetical protein
MSSRSRSGQFILARTAAAGRSNPRWLSSAPTDTTEEEEPLIVEATVVPPPPPPKEEGPSVHALEKNMKPLEIVAALDLHIVGQSDAKRAVAIAMRNRWRRRELPEELRKEVTPRNVLLVGPTGMYPFRMNIDGTRYCSVFFICLFVCFCFHSIPFHYLLTYL